jgi:large subunit ribosomal protein L7/L12
MYRKFASSAIRRGDKRPHRLQRSGSHLAGVSSPSTLVEEHVSLRGSSRSQVLLGKRYHEDLLERRYFHLTSWLADDGKKVGEKSKGPTATEPEAPPVEAPVDTKASKKVESPTVTSASTPVPVEPAVVEGIKLYSTPELTADAARHKAGLEDPTRPEWQNPLHHNNPDMQKKFREDFDSDEAFEAAVNPAPPINDGSGKVMAPAYLHELADEMVHLTMLEMNELVNKIADHYGFHEGMLSPGGDEEGADVDDEDGGIAAPVAEKTAFDVKLVSFDASVKIKIIKEVRALVPGLGLKEAKELVEGAPVALQKGVNKEEAEKIKAKLEELGAVMEIV